MRAALRDSVPAALAGLAAAAVMTGVAAGTPAPPPVQPFTPPPSYFCPVGQHLLPGCARVPRPAPTVIGVAP